MGVVSLEKAPLKTPSRTWMQASSTFRKVPTSQVPMWTMEGFEKMFGCHQLQMACNVLLTTFYVEYGIPDSHLWLTS